MNDWYPRYAKRYIRRDKKQERVIIVSEDVENYRIDHKKGMFTRTEHSGFAIEDYFRITITPLIVWVALAYLSSFALAFAEGKSMNLGNSGLANSLVSQLTFPVVMQFTFIMLQAVVSFWVGWRTVTLTHGSYTKAIASGALFSGMQYGVEFMLLPSFFPHAYPEFHALTLVAHSIPPFLAHTLDQILIAMVGVFAAHTAASE